MKIAPSMLSCDFSKIGEEIVRMQNAGADLIHLDVMDGNFVPNISFGSSVIAAMRPFTSLPFDVHLMIERPSRYFGEFVKAGGNHITFHLEAEDDVDSAIDQITALGATAGISIKPKTPASAVFPYLSRLHFVLVMLVEPGFGGQAIIPETLEKVRQIKEEILCRNLSTLIEVDGGVKANTVHLPAQAGADIFVAGTGVFLAEDAGEAIRMLRQNAENARR